jgi:hypothetical protein
MIRAANWRVSKSLRRVRSHHCQSERLLPLSAMFKYTVPKSSCWGHVIRPKDPLRAKQRVNTFFETYFERLAPEWDASRQISQVLSWRPSVLPNVEWPEDFLKPENQKVFFVLTGNRVMFAGGITFPFSSSEPASYEFLTRFVGDAPFRMSPQNFRVRVLSARGRWAWKKPEGEMAERLKAVFV